MAKKCPTPGKKAYDTRHEAYEAAKHLKGNVPYECCCSKYHLTKKKRAAR